MKKISINLLAICCCLLVFLNVLQAQKTDENKMSERVKQMQRLQFLAGNWSGKGWMITPKGERINFTIEENARFRLGKSVLIVEGLGKSKGKVIHDALGIVKYDEKEKKFVLEAFVANGNSVKMSPKVYDNKLMWGLKLPNGGQTRYTVIINEKGNWYEIGEYSSDGGKTWLRTMEMELSKKDAKKKIANIKAKRTAAMKKLDFLVGTWKGKGWIITRNGRETFTVTESLKRKLGGQIVVVNGLGKSIDKKTGKEKIVHQAYGVFSYDANADSIKFRWYKAETGEEDETTINISDKKLVWGFNVSESGVKVKFTESINEKGNWLEIGEVSRDGGKNWFKFFEMELSKVLEK